MTDAQLLAYWNEHIEARDEFIRTQRFTLTEIPPGKPQVEYHEQSDQWVPRGHVVRSVIVNDSPADMQGDRKVPSSALASALGEWIPS
jgi:hypothetical protein